LRFWIILGVFLAVAGTVLFWSGIDSRFGRTFPSPIVAVQPADSTTATARGTVETKQTTKDDLTANSPQSSTDTAPARSTVTEQITPRKSETAVTSKPVDIKYQPEVKSEISIQLILNDLDGRKSHLLRVLSEAGWTSEEIEQLAALLNDPRAHFRHEMLVRNATFKENAEQYAHNLTTASIDRCMDFLNDQSVPLNRAAIKEGVAPEVLVSILRVETNLGTYTGKESVFNVYWSLSIGDDPGVQREFLPTDPAARSEARGRMLKRAFWARGQLRDLLYVARHGGEDPVGIMGSFAGAFGMAQFIPSSYRAYGRDGNGDGVIDLDNIDDAAASIAYYLRENGWQDDATPARKRKVILSYNHSSFYADCVMALGDSISARRYPPQFP